MTILPTRAALVAASMLAISSAVAAQQVSDSSFRPAVSAPAFARGSGPVVLFDEAHRNFHRIEGRYRAFVSLLERDGYVVRANRSPFSRASLDSGRILVIANAVALENEEDWFLPTFSAFSDAEIAAVRDWVADGGSLLLIADHMPFAGAAAKLAGEFGALFGDGFATDSLGESSPMTFRRSDGSLAPHPIFDGRSPRERVDSVSSFTGQAFRLIAGGSPLMVLRKGSVLLLPEEAWFFSKRTPRVRADGMLQGAALEFGRGRVVLLGEAAMLSAQIQGQQRIPMGMNNPVAGQNPQFVLNVLHWLSRLN